MTSSLDKQIRLQEETEGRRAEGPNLNFYMKSSGGVPGRKWKDPHVFVFSHSLQELINSIKKAVPDSKFENLKKVLSENVDLSWLLDQAEAKKAEASENSPSTVSWS